MRPVSKAFFTWVESCFAAVHVDVSALEVLAGSMDDEHARVVFDSTSIVIRLDIDRWNATDNRFRREVIAHEIAHVLLGPISAASKDDDASIQAEEKICDTIARSWALLMSDPPKLTLKRGAKK